MIRIVIFLIIVGALALGAAWLADRPGDVVVTWQGWRIETSLMVLGAAVLAAVAVLLFVWTLLRAIFRSPFAFGRHLRRRRGERAYQAISQGLIAVGAGDLEAARKHVAEAKRIAPTEPLALLLSAQSAQLAGDRDDGRRRVPRYGEPPRYQNARLARLVRRGAPQPGLRQRPGDCRGSGTRESGVDMGRQGGSRSALAGGRLGGRAGASRSQQEDARQGCLSPPARGDADRSRASARRNRSRRRQIIRA